MLKRLKFGEERKSEKFWRESPNSPVWRILSIKSLWTENWTPVFVLCRQTCAIGVIGVIFEARPDAMVQVASLCIKSGNCAMLKGGSEAKRTDRKLFDVILRSRLFPRDYRRMSDAGGNPR